MPYDETLAQRVEQILSHQPGIVSRKMFGGLAFMLNGNMSVGILKDQLMVRVGPDGYEDALSLPHCRPMDFTGRPMRGFVVVEAEGISSNSDLRDWLDRGVGFALSLLPK